MPNWVKTYIRVKGKKEELDKLESLMVYQYAGENWVDRQRFFSKLMPMPKSISEDDADDWRDDHWGTKWEPKELWFSRHDAELLELGMETAWGTPKGIFKAITKQFPSTVLGGYYADECFGYNCGLISGRKGCIERADISDETKIKMQFSEKVWNMTADEFYVGKRLEKITKKKTPFCFAEVGLGEEEK